ncbi:MAG: HEPN domain-containing protein [Deltaproteobacteria bacterium]|nr:HEPN domain-containing protein [Deltaproteobacteria bacterium]
MSGPEDAAALLAMAEKDFRALGGMSDAEVFAEEVFGFHVQQTAEKALKAWIAALGQEYPLTHNLATLITVLQGHGVEVEALWDLVEYNPFGVQFRYQALDEEEPPLDREVALGQLSQLLGRVARLLEDAA